MGILLENTKGRLRVVGTPYEEVNESSLIAGENGEHRVIVEFNNKIYTSKAFYDVTYTRAHIDESIIFRPRIQCGGTKGTIRSYYGVAKIKQDTLVIDDISKNVSGASIDVVHDYGFISKDTVVIVGRTGTSNKGKAYRCGIINLNGDVVSPFAFNDTSYTGKAGNKNNGAALNNIDIRDIKYGETFMNSCREPFWIRFVKAGRYDYDKMTVGEIQEYRKSKKITELEWSKLLKADRIITGVKGIIGYNPEHKYRAVSLYNNIDKHKDPEMQYFFDSTGIMGVIIICDKTTNQVFRLIINRYSDEIKSF